MSNRNITLSLPEELIKRAKVAAARRDTSLSSMVAVLLQSTIGDVPEEDEIWDEEERVMRQGLLRIGTIDWSRDDVHSRG